MTEPRKLSEQYREYPAAVEPEQIEALEAALEAARGEAARLRSFIEGVADRDCEYGDQCPPFSGSRHGTCDGCAARAALAAPASQACPDRWHSMTASKPCPTCGESLDTVHAKREGVPGE